MNFHISTNWCVFLLIFIYFISIAVLDSRFHLFHFLLLLSFTFTFAFFLSNQVLGMFVCMCCVYTVTHVTEHFTYVVTTFNCNFWCTYLVFRSIPSFIRPFILHLLLLLALFFLLLYFIIISLGFFLLSTVFTSKWHIRVENIIYQTYELEHGYVYILLYVRGLCTYMF